ncbi:hypothetical protein [Sinorhizobium sp. RAC02]|uniref:hypothetical protein n=1 Tax=Sinorhizobium sp. RAC02 TaxID=1842534 RepID=UPI00083DC8C4|nr:hypothetical protein [Sinorhizobium sp. RAC02]AOF89788.1 hypothetical protein BSY16_2297 [Sinorhizobium sp. RAC02]
MKTTRRRFIAGISGIVASTIPAATATANSCIEPTIAQENPALLAAYERFVAACAEVATAEDALEWLVDEWRHRWPSAPEEILGGTNADRSFSLISKTAEKDIAGRFIRRPTADLTARMTRKMRESTPVACFSVETPEGIQRVITAWEIPRKGRTPAAQARHQKEQQKVLAKYRRKLPLSQAYYAETARLREASGVEKYIQRINAAKNEQQRASRAVSYAEAFTMAGIAFKAAALTADNTLDVFRKQEAGIFGEMTRFIDATLSVIGRAST